MYCFKIKYIVEIPYTFCKIAHSYCKIIHLLNIFLSVIVFVAEKRNLKGKGMRSLEKHCTLP